MSILEWTAIPIGIIRETENSIDVPVRMLTTGEFTDMEGTDVKVTKEMLEKIAERYKDDLQLAYNIEKAAGIIRTASLAEYDNKDAPIQLRHIHDDPEKTIGHLVGFFKVEQLCDHLGNLIDDYGLFGIGRFEGKDSMNLIRDRKIRNLSIQFNLETYEFVELSGVVHGADKRAMVLFGKNKMLSSHEVNDNKYILLYKNNCKIKDNDVKIAALEKQIYIEKYLIALCRRDKITKAKARFISSQIQNISNGDILLKILDKILETRQSNIVFAEHTHRNDAIFNALGFIKDM